MKKVMMGLIIVAVVFLGGCDAINSIKSTIIEPLRDDTEELANQTGYKIIKAIEENNPEELVSLFSKEAKNQDKNLKGKVVEFFSNRIKTIEYSQTINEWYRQNAEIKIREKPESSWLRNTHQFVVGHKPMLVEGLNEVVLDGEIYAIYFTYIYRYKYLGTEKGGSDNPNWLGLLTCAIFKTEDRIEPYEKLYADNVYDENIEEILNLAFEPGFYFYPAKETLQ